MKIVRLGLIAAGLVGAALLRGPLGQAHERRRQVELPYVPPAPFARISCAGHTSTMADLLWLQALPDLSRRFAREDESEQVAMQRKRLWLDQVLDVITELEPKFSTAYSYGSAYYDLVARDHDRAIELLQQGVDANPDDLLLRINLGMTVLIHKRDRREALRIFQEVIDHPRCDSWSLALCTKLMVDEREDVAALERCSRFLNSQDEPTRRAAELYVERTRKHIFLRAYREFESLNQRKPRSNQELRDPRLMAVGVMDEVLNAGVIHADGSLSFPRLFEIEFRTFLKAAKQWSEVYHESHGRWPSYEDLKKSKSVSLPRLPVGKAVVLDEGEVRIVDVDPPR